MPEGTGEGEQQTQTQTQAGTGEQKPPKTFLQDEVDAIIADRLNRERMKFADYEALKQKAAAFDQAEAAKQTELERAQAAMKAAQDESQATMAKANGVLKRAGILTEAAAQKAADPEMVAMLLLNAEGITVDAEGNVTGAKEAVKKLLKDKPFLTGQTGGSSGGEFGGTNEPGLDQQIAEAEAKGDYMTAMSLKMKRAGGIPGA